MITDPISWTLWLFCLAAGVLCFRVPKRRNGNLRWLSPRLWFGIAFIFLNVLVPLNIMVTGRTYRGIFLQGAMNLMLLASALAGTSFLIGWRLGKFRLGKKRDSSTIAFPSARQYVVRAFLLIPIVALTVVGFLQGMPETEWLVVWTAWLSSLIAVASLVLLAFTQTRGSCLRVMLAVIAIAVVLLYLWVIVHLSARLHFLLLMMPLAALWLYSRKRTGIVPLLAMALAFVWFFVFYGGARYYMFLEQEQSLSTLLELAAPRDLNGVYERLFLEGDLDAFENGMLVMELIPSSAGFYYGSTFATLFVLPIPRPWWPGKPEASVNYLVADNFMLPNTNFAISLVAEGYANFWWPGVVLIFLLFGFVSRRMRAATLLNRRDPERGVHLGLYCAYVVLVMRGSFHSMTSYYLYVVVWMVISAWVVRLLKRLSQRN